MKKVDNSAADNNAAGDGWFKIMELGYDEKDKKWCTEKLTPANGHLEAKIPEDLEKGYYLVRPELLALHQADKTPPDPQFYVGCAQIFLSSGGSSRPKDTVSIPGYVSLKTPAMTYNVWKEPLALPFPDFGPPLYSPAKPKPRLGKRAEEQTKGLKPENCVMENANWCAFMPPSYSDQEGCWAVSYRLTYMRSTKLTFYRRPKIAQLSLMGATNQPPQLEIRTAASGKNTVPIYVDNVVLLTTKALLHVKTTCLVRSRTLREKRSPRMAPCLLHQKAKTTRLR